MSGFLVIGLLGALGANAIEPSAAAAQSENPSCHMMTRVVAVWPHGPWKSLQSPRYERRAYLACNQDKGTMSVRHKARLKIGSQ
jgi:hypothetical protein